MSRVGRVPIKIPQDVTVSQGIGNLKIKGPKGELGLDIHSKIKIHQDNNQLTVEKRGNNKLSKSLYGLTQRLVNNMVIGVTEGFEKKLEIKGVGYRAQTTVDGLILNVGYSHPIEMKKPEGIEVNVKKNIITVSGIDKQKVGQFAAEIRQNRKPEPYKGVGIRYVGEIVRRKAGKTVKATGAGA